LPMLPADDGSMLLMEEDWDWDWIWDRDRLCEC